MPKMPGSSSRIGEQEVDLAAERLFQAFCTGVAIEPLSEGEHTIGVEEAYAIQHALRRRHEQAGRAVTARKIGLTSEGVQRQLGVHEPDFGVVFDSHVFQSGATLSRSELHMVWPRLEAELAFEFQQELQGPGLTGEDVLAREPTVIPIFEVIDSRIVDWRITLPDTIADNASGLAAVLGKPAPLGGRDLAATELTLSRDGQPLASGVGAAVMGHPARAVAWLANTLSGFGESLPAGQLVLSGSFTAALDATVGRYEAAFGDGLGSVVVEVVA